MFVEGIVRGVGVVVAGGDGGGDDGFVEVLVSDDWLGGGAMGRQIAMVLLWGRHHDEVYCSLLLALINSPHNICGELILFRK